MADRASARDIWWRAAALEEGIEHIDKLPVEALRQFARDAMRIPRVDDLNKRNKSRIEHGLLLGIIVYEATYLAKNDPNRAALYKVQHDLSQRLKGTFQNRAPNHEQQRRPDFAYEAGRAPVGGAYLAWP